MKLMPFCFSILIFLTQGIYACDENKSDNFMIKNQGDRLFVLNSNSSVKDISFYRSFSDDEFPDVTLFFVSHKLSSQKKGLVDSFSYNGRVANIEAAFWGEDIYTPNLFVIVSWIYNLDGINTVGKYYNVFVYDYKKDGFTKNDKITALFDGGHDGFLEGESVLYRFKTAQAILLFLKQYYDKGIFL